MMDRQEALRRLTADRRTVPEDQLFKVRFYQPEDGAGLARLFHAVYGDGYPIDLCYIPDQLTEANRNGSIRGVVAYTAAGDVVSHVAFYRSSSPNPNLYEYGMGMTLPAYRSSLAFARCNELLQSLFDGNGIDAFFGEAVCNHIITQKLCCNAGALETAMEPSLMPALAFEAEKSAAGRVGCVFTTKIIRDRRRSLCVPPPYSDQIDFLMAGLGLDRTAIEADRRPSTEHAVVETVHLPHAGVARCAVSAPGGDLVQQMRCIESELRKSGYALLQCFVPLGYPWAASVVDQLRQTGFFPGGVLPVWFGDDGLLMQKLFVDPAFEDMRLHSERAMRIRDIVRADWKRAQVGIN